MAVAGAGAAGDSIKRTIADACKTLCGLQEAWHRLPEPDRLPEAAFWMFCALTMAKGLAEELFPPSTLSPP